MRATGSMRFMTDSASKTMAESFGLTFHRHGIPQSRHTPESFLPSLLRGAYSPRLTSALLRWRPRPSKAIVTG